MKSGRTGRWDGKDGSRFGNVHRPEASSKYIDVKEVLKAEAAAQGEGSVNSGADFNYPFITASDVAIQNALAISAQSDYREGETRSKIPTAIQSSVSNPLSGQIGISDIVLEFDSLRATNIDESNGAISFDANVINKQQSIGNVIEMEIYEFFFPDISTEVYQPSFFFYRNLAMKIDQLSSPGTQTNSSGIDHHFAFQANLAGVMRLATPIDSRFTFKTPVTDISQLTFRFSAAGKTITLPTLSYLVTSVTGSNPGRFTFGVPRGLDSAITHAIYFSGFNTPDAALNAIVNDRNGQMVTVIDATTVELDAAAGAAFPVLTYTATAVIAARRIIFQMRFRRLESSITNYIVPV